MTSKKTGSEEPATVPLPDSDLAKLFDVEKAMEDAVNTPGIRLVLPRIEDGDGLGRIHFDVKQTRHEGLADG